MRDAMVIFKEKVQKIDENSTEHFEVTLWIFNKIINYQLKKRLF